MCFQNLIQVYSTETADSESVHAVVVYARMQKLGDQITPEFISFEISDARAIGKALIKLANDYDE